MDKSKIKFWLSFILSGSVAYGLMLWNDLGPVGQIVAEGYAFFVIVITALACLISLSIYLREQVFSPSKNLPLTAKFLSWYVIVLGTISIGAPFTTQPPVQTFPYIFNMLSIIFGLLSFYAAYHILEDKVWAFWLLLFLYLIQSVEYFSDTFSFTLIGPVHLKFGWAWFSPPMWINFNLLALVVVVIANNNITRHRLTHSSCRTSNGST